MRTFHHVLRAISGGGSPGEIVDSTEWKYTQLLVESHRMVPLDMAVAVKAPKCICGRRWVDKTYLVAHQAGCEKALGTAPINTPELEPEPAA